MSLESSGARAEQLARQVSIHGAPVSASILEAKIAAVGEAAVRDTALRLFTDAKQVWSEVGPGASGANAARMARRLAGD